jgi:hypothetical protein
MRVGRGSTRVISERLYSAARQSAEAISATGSVAIGLPRYLVLLGDALQNLPPSPSVRSNGAAPAPRGGRGGRGGSGDPFHNP